MSLLLVLLFALAAWYIYSLTQSFQDLAMEVREMRVKCAPAPVSATSASPTIASLPPPSILETLQKVLVALRI